MKNSQAKKPLKLIKQGDIFQLGDHLLLCGSAMNTDDVEKLLFNRKVKLILTDVPYGVAYVEGKKEFSNLRMSHKEIANDEIQSEDKYAEFMSSWLETIRPYLETKNSYYIFNSDKMIFALRKALIFQKFYFSELLVWIKTHSVIGRLDYLPQHELIAYGWFGKHEFLKSKDKSVLIYPKPNKSKLHPTMKPIGLLRRLILNSSRIGDYIYDPFGGSGSTLIACEQTRRRCLMVEISPKYCETIINRYEKITGKQVSLISNHE